MLKNTHGFSLIELIVVVAIIGILMASGIPGINNYITNSRVRSVASDFREGLQLARREAIKINSSVSFCMSSEKSTGWEIRKGLSCVNGDYIRGKSESSSESQRVAVEASAVQVVFGADGRVRSNTNAGTSGVGLSATIDSSWSSTCGSGSTCVRMRVEISPGGMIRVCDQSMPAGDPQACQ